MQFNLLFIKAAKKVLPRSHNNYSIPPFSIFFVLLYFVYRIKHKVFRVQVVLVLKNYIQHLTLKLVARSVNMFLLDFLSVLSHFMACIHVAHDIDVDHWQM